MARIIVVLIAVTAGLIAGGISLQATWRPEPEPLTVKIEVPSVEVLVPTRDLLRGAKLTSEFVAWSNWPEDRVNAGMILRADDSDAKKNMEGRLLRSNVYTGEPLRREHLAKGDGGFLSLVLQPGTRAVGVEIGNEKTAGGFVLPNDRVDVLHTVIRDVDGDGSAMGATRTILTNVRVLAIGQTSFEEGALAGQSTGPAPIEPPTSNGTTITGKTATLEVTTEQAEVLLSAAITGQLSLALRAAEDFGLSGLGDLSTIEGRQVAPVTTQLAAAAQSLEPPAKVEEAPKTEPDESEVQIIGSGRQRSIVLKTF